MSEELNIDKEQLILDIEAEIAEHQIAVDRGNNLAALKKMPAFQDVIVDGYIDELSTYLFDELTKSITFDTIPEDTLREGLVAIRHIKSYIGFDGLKGDIEYNAEIAKNAIVACEEQINKL